jgi:hypothetical protein
MVCEPPRPHGPGHTSESNRKAIKAQKAEQKRLARLEKQRAKVEKRKAEDAAERAYLSQWPESKYPGRHDPTRYLAFESRERPEVPCEDGIWRMDKDTQQYPRASEEGLRKDWRTTWRNMHERWQRIRARLMRRLARTPADRVVIYRTCPEYNDMRVWELRRVARASGWDERDRALWQWWASLPFKKRFLLISDTWLKGVRVNRPWIFQNAPKPKEIAA